MSSATEGAASFPCPVCGEAVPVPFVELLRRGKLCCGGCGLTLEVDLQKSEESLDLLRDLDEGQRKVREMRGGGTS